MAGTNLYRTPTARTNNQKFTYSCWFKKSTTGTDEYFVTNYESGNNFGYINNGNTDKFVIYDKAGGTERLQAESNFVIRDTNAWYHLVYSVDSTASSNRVKFYINGVDRFSDFTVATAMAQNSSVGFQQGTTSNGFRVGSQQTGSATFNGLMSHVNFVDGLQLDASAFGETDSTTGEWKIKTSPTVSEYGNNGFFILKDGNSVTDQSGKGNNFGIGGSVGSLTKTEDCPSNVFNTLNPLDNYYSNYTYAQGNTAVSSTSSNRTYVTSTLGMPSGKYYWECKLDSTLNSGTGGASTSVYVGITGQTPISPSQFPSDGTCFNCVMNTNGQVYSNGSTIGSAMGSGWSNSTIVMMAYDADNNKMYFGKDGTWLNSGDPTSGSTGTGAFTPTTSASATPIGVYMPQWGVDWNASYVSSFNFGNGYFGTTAVSSAGTNASGNGIFEYDVPTGYTALSTKGLNL